MTGGRFVTAVALRRRSECHNDAVRFRRLMESIEGHMERGNRHMEQGNLYMERGNRHMERGNALMEEGNLHMERGNLHMERGNRHMERGNALMEEVREEIRFTREEVRLSREQHADLRIFIRESSLRAERFTERVVAELQKLSAGQDDLRGESRAQTKALLLVLDRLGPGASPG